MPNRSEFYKQFIHIDFKGGSCVAEAKDGGVVAFSRFGEFHCVVNDEGGVIADFVDKGVVCTYTDEGELEIVMLEVSQLLKCIDERDMHLLANEGKDVSAVIDYLDSHKEELYIMLSPKDRRFRMEQSSDFEVISVKEFVVTDFGIGIDGEIKLGKATLAYHTSKNGDEFQIAVGECRGKERSLMPVYLSNSIDVENDLITASDPKMYYKLADKVFLNR